MRFIASTLAAAAIAATAIAPAQAAEPVVVDIEVSYHDLDLQDPDDARIMVRRIERAARRACGGVPNWHVLGSLTAQATARAEFEACRQAAVENAVSGLGSEAVYTAYRASAARAG